MDPLLPLNAAMLLASAVIATKRVQCHYTMRTWEIFGLCRWASAAHYWELVRQRCNRTVGD